MEEGDNLSLMEEVTEGELKEVLQSFQKDKSLGSDGWMMEFYMHFFELFGIEISEVVNKSRMQGKIHEVLNYTYLTLIPKKDRLDTFNDFCNAPYFD